MCEMLWNDPQDQPGMLPNKVGRGTQSGHVVSWVGQCLGNARQHFPARHSMAQHQPACLPSGWPDLRMRRPRLHSHVWDTRPTHCWAFLPRLLQRGVGVAFGPDVAKRWLESQGLQMVVRSHEVRRRRCRCPHTGGRRGSACCMARCKPARCDLLVASHACDAGAEGEGSIPRRGVCVAAVPRPVQVASVT